MVSLRRGHVNHPLRLLAGEIVLNRHIRRNDQDPAQIDGGVDLKGEAFSVSVPRFQQEQVGDHVALVCGGSQVRHKGVMFSGKATLVGLFHLGLASTAGVSGILRHAQGAGMGQTFHGAFD